MNQVVLSVTNDFYEITDNIKKASTKIYEFNLSVNHEGSLIWSWYERFQPFVLKLLWISVQKIMEIFSWSW